MKTILTLIVLFSIVEAYSQENKSSFYKFFTSSDTFFCKGEFIKGYNDSKVINVYADTTITLLCNDKKEIVVFTAGKRSDINGLFYFIKNKKEFNLLLQHTDSLSIFNIEVYIKDIDNQTPKEIVATWNHEGDVFFITVDQITETDEINNIFKSKDLGVPWIRDSQILYTRNDSLFFLYMLNDGSAHIEAQLKYDPKGELKMEEIKRISH